MHDTHTPPLIFGIYPGRAAGSDVGAAAGPLDDPVLIQDALSCLQVGGYSFLVRGYLQYTGPCL